MGKKLRCKNCGTTIKDDEKSCSICRMVVERVEVEGEEGEIEVKTTFPIDKIAMVAIILIGIILTIKGFVEYQNVEVCTADDCGFKSLFMAGLGIILMISAGIALAKSDLKYKIRFR